MLHKNNVHRDGYDMDKLVKALPALSAVVRQSPKGRATIDFSDPEAVKLLNQALLKAHYGIDFWDIPEGYLCPPVPGRADYIHYLADILGSRPGIRVLDIGTGANVIYPILGHCIYGWTMVGTEIDPQAVRAAKGIVAANSKLKGNIEIREQQQPDRIFSGVLEAGETFAAVLCNPPFFASAKDAQQANFRKRKNLGLQNKGRNFGGQSAELWVKGGESAFIRKMIEESKTYRHQIEWFSSLISQKDNLIDLQIFLRKQKVKTVKVIEMAQGQKKSRILLWSWH